MNLRINEQKEIVIIGRAWKMRVRLPCWHCCHLPPVASCHHFASLSIWTKWANNRKTGKKFTRVRKIFDKYI